VGILKKIAFLFFVLTTFLSIWQLSRLVWKENLIAELNAKAHLPPLETSQNLEAFRQIVLKGQWILKPLFLQYKVYKDEAGCEVVLPLSYESGGTFLVNLGWQKSCHILEKKLPPLAQKSVGLLKPFENSLGSLKNIPGQEWYFMDFEQMQNFLGIGLQEFYIDIEKGIPKLPNNHLMYALTWAILSIFFAFQTMFLRKGVRW
jgi:surfeit locus 1 family protein